jgi:outer membrane protein assembly factor BamA
VAPKPASFDLRAEPDVKTLGAWLRPDEPGRMTGSLRLSMSGTASAPSIGAIDARIVLEPDTVTVRDVPFTLPRAAEVRIEHGRATADGVALTAPGTTASVSGSLGLTGERVVDADVSASGSLGFLSSLVPGRLAGAFKGSFKASGPVADPVLSGNLSLEDAAWVWQEQRLALRDWSGEAVLSAKALTIERLEGQVNGGDASVSGSVQLGGQGGAGLTMRVRDAFVEVVKGLRSQADAELTLTLVDDGATLAGKVTVTSGAYREPITAMARLFSAPRTTSAAPAGGASALDAVALDIELTASSPIIIDNSAGHLDLVPSMTLKGTLAEPVIFGSLDMVDQGRLTLMGRTFRLTEGRVVFPGAGDPAVQLIGETRVGDYQVTLRTQGPVTDMEATYTSDPPLSQRDVQSLLVTGRTTDASATKSDADEEFVLGTASSDLLGMAGQMVGLDSVQLGRGDFELGSSDVSPAMRLTVSKRLNARTSLVLSQDLENNKLTWIAIFAPGRGYEIRLSQRDNEEEVIEFRQEIAFGPGVSPPSSAGLRKRVKGPRVSDVSFTGEPGFPASDLASVIKLKRSVEFDAGRWQADRERLEGFYRDRGYAVARIAQSRTFGRDADRELVALTYRIDRGPRTSLAVEGVDLDGDERESLMRAWSASVLPEFVKDDLTREVRGLLASRGHLRPTITVSVDATDPDVYRASVTVDGGPETRTRALAFEGVQALGEAELRAQLEDRVDLAAAWVDPAPLVDAVKALYEERGRSGTSVAADPIAFEGSTAALRIRVREAPAAVLGEIILTGVAQERDAAARASLGIAPGTSVEPSTELDARRRLERFYLDRGFRSAKVATTRSLDAEGRVTMGFAVTEGPMSVVTGLTFEGLQATKQAFASGAVTLKPGDPAGQRGAADTQKQLYGLGVFRRADVSFEPAPAAAPTVEGAVPVNVKVSLEEARRYQLRYGVQLSNEYGPVYEDFTSAIGVAADVRDRNFLGRAFGLGASGRLEKNLQSLRGQFSLPPLLSQRLQTSLFATIRSETDTSEQDISYTDKERDITFEQRFRLPRRMEVSWGYSYNLRDVEFLAPDRTAAAELKGVLASLNGTFVLDARDKPFDASRGWFQSSNFQWGLEPLGSDLNYFRILLRQFYYKPAGPLIFASGVRWGWLHGLGDYTGLPPITIFDRFFDAGGSTTVRGYAEDSLSAFEVFGVPVGGSKLLLLNQEVRFRLFSKWLQGAVFIDAGNTFRPGTSIRLDELAVGTGFGIRVMTPFAPIRIDVGYPLDRRPEDRSYRFHFSIGQIF